MMRIAFMLAALMVAGSGALKADNLSVAGVDLGRIDRANLHENAAFIVPAEGLIGVQGFIVARFQNNQPVMKSGDGTWRAWDGDVATLEVMTIYAADDVLRFSVGQWPTQDVSAPCTFTIGYRSADGLKFGYFTVDGL